MMDNILKPDQGVLGGARTPPINPTNPVATIDAVDKKLKDTALKKGMLMGALGVLASSSMDRGILPTMARGALTGIQGYENSLNKQRTDAALSAAATDPYFKNNKASQLLLKAGKVGEAVKLAKIDDTTKSQRIMHLASLMSRNKATEEQKKEYWLLVQSNPINQLQATLLGGIGGAGGDPLGLLGDSSGAPKPPKKPKPLKPTGGGNSGSVLDDDF